MKVSQAAIDEVRAVRLADEAELQSKEFAKLTRMVNCCATCSHQKDWHGYMLCTKHEADTKPSLVCNDYERRMQCM